MCVVFMMTALSFQLLVTKKVAPPATRVVHLFGRPGTLCLPHFLHEKRQVVNYKFVERALLFFLRASQKSSLAFDQSFKLDNQPALTYPFVKQTVKFITHPPQLTAVLLGRPQGRGGRLRPSPKWSPVSGGTSFLFPLRLELLVPGDGGCVGLRVDPDSTSSCKKRKVRWEKN